MVTKRPAIAAVVLAGGSGSRFASDGNKAYVPLAGRRILSWSLNAFAALPETSRTVLVVRTEDYDTAARVCDREVDAEVELVVGGDSRHESEHHALRHLSVAIESGEIDVVMIHDAARPLANSGLIRSVAGAALAHGAALPALPDPDLAAVDESGRIVGAPLRDLARVQTPQAFAAAPLWEAFEAAARARFRGSDTASCVERYSDLAVRWVYGDPRNIKITYPQDLFVAEQILARAHYRLM